MQFRRIAIVAILLLGSMASALGQGFEDDRFTREIPIPTHPSLDLRVASCEKNDDGTIREYITTSRTVNSRRSYSAALVFHAVPDLSGQFPYCDKNSAIVVRVPGGKAYDRVYDSTRSEFYGDLHPTGMRLIGWSPDGWHLLVDVPGLNSTAAGENVREPLVYDALHRKTLEFSVSDLLKTRFNRQNFLDCDADISVLRWIGNREILLRVSPVFLQDSPGRHSCVKRPLLYSFNVQNNRVRRIPDDHPSTKRKKQRNS